MNILWTRHALRGVRRQPGLKAEFDVMIERWLETGLGDITAMKGSTGFRARIRDWRAVFSRRPDGVIIVKAGHRRDVYRR